MNEWFIKLFRSLLDWERYDDINVRVLFIHLMLKANYTDRQRKWIDIKKGEYLTSYNKLSQESWLTPMQVRWAIKKLIRTKEVTHKQHSNYTLLKLNNYDKYNWSNTLSNKSVTHEQHSSNTRVTTTKEGKKERKEKNNIVTNNIDHSLEWFSLDEENSSNGDIDIWSEDKKEEKVKPNKNIVLEKSFEKFWDLYPKKVNKKKAEQRFMLLNLNQLDNLFVWLGLYLKKWESERTQKIYIPGPDVWIWNEKWTDDIFCDEKPKKYNKEIIKKQEDEQRKKNEEELKNSKLSCEKRKIRLDFWNSLSKEKQEQLTLQAKKECISVMNMKEETLNTTFWKPAIKARLWNVIDREIELWVKH